MNLSVLDLFKVGIGPSSSHTVGPMRAAQEFVASPSLKRQLAQVVSLRVDLYGSLALTGKGHATDRAILLGLSGEVPDLVNPDCIDQKLAQIRNSGQILLAGRHAIAFSEAQHVLMHRRESLAHHPNGMRFTAFDADGAILATRTCYSIGGGFVVDEADIARGQQPQSGAKIRFPFRSAAELLVHCERENKPVSAIILANEGNWRTEHVTRDSLAHIWQTMDACIERGLRTGGILPGGLKVERRALALHRKLCSQVGGMAFDPLSVMDWITLWALAVNEENAAGGRVVTAPTNGAAGIVPAVLKYYLTFIPGANEEGVIRFLLTAAAVGFLFKTNASISGAEVGCQGEVGVACSMAAAGLAEVMGGTPQQVENAAEIGMEHNLGLTCDPIGGLVQIPCIERNAVGACKAVHAARIALHGTGKHMVSLDKVIRTMRITGADMKNKYKETSKGGLAVGVPVSAVDC